MIYVIGVLIIFFICLLVKSPYNKHTYFFGLMVAGLIVMVFASITLWKYSYPNLWFFQLEYKIILKLISNFYKYYQMLNIFNISLVVYMLALQFFVWDFDRNRYGNKIIARILLFIIYCVIYIWFYSSNEENNWHIYTDDEGEESKKQYIENPTSLTFNVDFGDPKDYREETKYKIGYRYYIQSIYDTSQMMIAGEEIKDGWRLVGEDTTTEASEDGFVFYRNALPEMHIECFSYKYHDITGLMTDDCSPSELSERYFPYDAFENGVTVQMIANDFDREDILSVSYRLEDATNDTEVVSGTFTSDFKITTDYKTSQFRLFITVTDNFGGSTTSEPFLFMMDLYSPSVTGEFDDGGYALKGKNLFSDFYIDDDPNVVMTERKVFADIYLNDGLVDSVELENRGNGVFRLDETGMADGEYTVHLKMYDKAGNEGEHYFYQTLDNTTPTMNFITPEQDSSATYYSKWMNVSKNIIVDVADEYAGIKSYKLTLNGSTVISGSYGGTVPTMRFNRQVSVTKTGKLCYSFQAYDNAKSIRRKTPTTM